MKTISKLKSKFIPVNTPKICKDEKKYVNNCLTSGWISSEGPEVKKFQKQFDYWFFWYCNFHFISILIK